MTAVNPFPTADHTFGLCLTHDVDRPYKHVHAPFYAAIDRDLSHLRSLRPSVNPWWQFEEILDIESSLGVRSAFYFLREQHLFRDRSVRQWADPRCWIEYLGRYDPRSPDIASIIERLDEEGWEVGLHGSLGTDCDPERLGVEKELLESVLGHEVVGGRQHHLRLSIPETWRHYADLGLSYDATLGSRTEIGFNYGYDLLCPFDDDFVVFPLTVMDTVLIDSTDGIDDARRCLDGLLQHAHANGAVMTALWHPRNFSESDYPGQGDLYCYLIERALELGAWVGSPADLYCRLDLNATGVRQPGTTTNVE